MDTEAEDSADVPGSGTRMRRTDEDARPVRAAMRARLLLTRSSDSSAPAPRDAEPTPDACESGDANGLLLPWPPCPPPAPAGERHAAEPVSRGEMNGLVGCGGCAGARAGRKGLRLALAPLLLPASAAKGLTVGISPATPAEALPPAESGEAKGFAALLPLPLEAGVDLPVATAATDAAAVELNMAARVTFAEDDEEPEPEPEPVPELDALAAPLPLPPSSATSTAASAPLSPLRAPSAPAPSLAAPGFFFSGDITTPGGLVPGSGAPRIASALCSSSRVGGSGRGGLRALGTDMARVRSLSAPLPVPLPSPLAPALLASPPEPAPAAPAAAEPGEPDDPGVPCGPNKPLPAPAGVAGVFSTLAMGGKWPSVMLPRALLSLSAPPPPAPPSAPAAAAAASRSDSGR